MSISSYYYREAVMEGLIRLLQQLVHNPTLLEDIIIAPLIRGARS